jgi:hypothetical protein
MSRIIAFVVSLVVVGLVSGRAGAQGDGKCKRLISEEGVRLDGDINGDGKEDLTDAIHLLTDLFIRPQPPVPLCGLPPTGVKYCWNDRGDRIPCENTNYPRQDGFVRAGGPSEGRFVVTEHDTVIDTCTGLEWKRGPVEFLPGEQGIYGATGDHRATWQNALKYCEDVFLLGNGEWHTDPALIEAGVVVKHADWRLPNINELLSLVNWGSYDGRYEGFDYGPYPTWLWSSTMQQSSDTSASFNGIGYAYCLLTGRIFHLDAGWCDNPRTCNCWYGPVTFAAVRGDGDPDQCAPDEPQMLNILPVRTIQPGEKPHG